MLRYFRVFNASQCDNLPERYTTPIPQGEAINKTVGVEHAEEIIKGYSNKPKITHGYTHACYRPQFDEIEMPTTSDFDSFEHYYSTLFHEMVHSTGHESRINRNLDTPNVFGSEDYSKEELIAEMGAAFLCGEAQILNETINQSASYIQGWVKKLQDDPKLIVCAAAAAQKATDHILGKTYEDQEETK